MAYFLLTFHHMNDKTPSEILHDEKFLGSDYGKWLLAEGGKEISFYVPQRGT